MEELEHFPALCTSVVTLLSKTIKWNILVEEFSAWKCTLSCTGNATFGNNLAQSYRGGIYAWYNTLNFTGNIDFRSNSPLCGGGIFAKYNTTSLAALLSEQLRKIGGGIAVSWTSAASNTTFRNNSAEYDGGGLEYQTGLNFIGNTTFRKQFICEWWWGNWSIEQHFEHYFQNQLAETYGGGIRRFFSTLSFSGNTTFVSNSAKQFGRGIYTSDHTLNFTDFKTFTKKTQQNKMVEESEHLTALCTALERLLSLTTRQN